MVVDTLSAIFSALSDPTRRSIVERLRRGQATINEVAEPFAMTQQAVSKHLACLERARIIRKKRVGRQHFCSLRPNAIREVAAWADRYREIREGRFSRLDKLLEEMQGRPKRGRESR